MFFPKDLLSKTERLNLNAIEELLLKEFALLDTSMKIKKVYEFLNNYNIDIIVKLACNNQAFREVCLLPQFSKTWVGLWSTYGIIITRDRKKALCDQPNTEKFDLFLGIYFYNKALQAAKYLEKDFTEFELGYLSEAIKYGSIHAYQKQHRYLYSLTQPWSTASEPEKLTQVEQIIASLKRLIPTYGTYAYLLLAEAYVRYGLLLGSGGNMILAERAQQSALKACAVAEAHYTEDTNTLIFNASLGGTLLETYYSIKSINFVTIKAMISTYFETLESEVTSTPSIGL